jgi:hypothetical protein
MLASCAIVALFVGFGAHVARADDGNTQSVTVSFDQE